jgi:hypothetical membrane protein
MDRARTRTVLAGAAWLLAGLIFVTVEAIAATQFTPGYDYAVNYISELGVVGCKEAYNGVQACSPRADLMNAAFIGSGLLFGIATVLIYPQLQGKGRRRLLVLGITHAIGLVLVGVFHGGAFVGAEGLAVFHVIGALMAIVGGNLAIAFAPVARDFNAPTFFRRFGPCAAAVGLGGLVVLVISSGVKLGIPPGEGAWERLSVYTISVWDVLIGAWLLLPRRS